MLAIEGPMGPTGYLSYSRHEETKKTEETDIKEIIPKETNTNEIDAKLTPHFSPPLSLKSSLIAEARNHIVAAGGLFDFFAALCDDSRDYDERYQYACDLANFSANERQVKEIIAAGGLERLKHLMKLSPPEADKSSSTGTDNIRAMAFLCLSNIAGTDVSYRDLLIREGFIELGRNIIIDGVARKLAPDDKGPRLPIMLCQNIAWFFFSVFRQKPLPERDECISCIRPIVEMLRMSTDTIMIQRCLWALAEIIAHKEAKEIVARQPIMALLTFVFHTEDEAIRLGAIRVFGGMASGDEEIVNALVTPEYRILNHMKQTIMDAKYPDTVTRTLWALSNITNEASDTIIQEIVNAGLVPVLVRSLSDDKNANIREEALRTLANIARCGSAAHIQHVTDQPEVVPLMCEFLNSGMEGVNLETFVNDSLDVLMVLLRNEENKIKVKPDGSRPPNPCAQQIFTLGAYEILIKLEKLKTPLGERAKKVLDYYF